MSAPPSDPPSDRDSPEPPPPSRPRPTTNPRLLARAPGPMVNEHIDLADLRDRIDHVEMQLGEAPDASTGRKGSGMARVLVRLSEQVAEMQAEQRRVAEARARWARIIGIPSVAAAVAVAASLVAIMAKLFGW